MKLVPAFGVLLQGLAATISAPKFANLTVVLAGWVFAGRRTVTRMITAAGPLACKHLLSYHRLFCSARWSLDVMGLTTFNSIQPFFGNVVMLGLDDTLARKRGLKMFGTGMHYAPILSSRSKAITNWGHSWVLLSILVELPFCRGHSYRLRILFRLYLNQRSAASHPRLYRTRPQLAIEILEVLCTHRETQHFHDRGREVRVRRTPLPPNRTGGFPAYGSPVSSCPAGIVRNECGPPADYRDPLS